MLRIAIGYVAVVAILAMVILLNPMDFMGKDARKARLAEQVAPPVAQEAPGSVAATTAEVLAGLNAAPSPETAEDAALRKMSEAVIAGLQGAPSPAAAPATLGALVAEALAAGKSDTEIDALVNQAVAAGEIAAPAGLMTTEGTVDTAVLLASIVAEAQTGAGDEFGQGDLSEPTTIISGGTLSMQAATEDVLYVVQAGDSLGALALRFYGKADLSGAIFKANRQVMETPESLRDGMKLLIPARSGL